MTRFSNFTDEELDAMEATFCNGGLKYLVDEVRRELRYRTQKVRAEATREFYIEILKQYKEKPTLINEISSVEEAVWLDGSLDAAIKALESANRAHWIDNKNNTISCSYCHTWFYKDDRYSYMRHCPVCGAKMIETEAEE